MANVAFSLIRATRHRSVSIFAELAYLFALVGIQIEFRGIPVPQLKNDQSQASPVYVTPHRHSRDSSARK